MKSNCKYSTRCGGCEYLDKSIKWQTENKTNTIKELFKEFNGVKIDKCYTEYYPLKYRNKVHLAFGELKGKTIIGFYEENSSKITDVNICLLFGDWLAKLIEILREFVSRFKIRPYTRFGTGIIRYAHARCIDNKIQLTLVVTTDNFPGRDWLFNKLKEYFSDVSLYIDINKRTDHAVFDRLPKFIKGSKFLNFKCAGVDVSLSPNSFLQVNLPVAEKMYKTALDMLEIKDDTIVLDLYSGIGITSIMFSKKCSNVVSIEEVPIAVDNAKFMAKLNRVNNIHFMCGKCEKEISKFKNSSDVVVFVDPARAGLDTKVIKSISNIKPRKIVYMSCNPETCVRDIKSILVDNSYSIETIKPYNMFPYTKHIEMLVCLQRKI